MRTLVYLLHHGATDATRARSGSTPAPCEDPALAPAGVRQAEATRNFLAIRPIDHCYCSPLRSALQTAVIVAAPHGLTPKPLEALAECDLGHSGGLDALSIGRRDSDSFDALCGRMAEVMETIISQHPGQAVLVVGHHLANRAYLANVMGLSAAQVRHMRLDTCGISVIVRYGAETTVSTVNATFHLQGVAA